MLAFGLCSHGMADCGNGDLKIAFSDQLYSLEKLLKDNLKIIHCILPEVV